MLRAEWGRSGRILLGRGYWSWEEVEGVRRWKGDNVMCCIRSEEFSIVMRDECALVLGRKIQCHVIRSMCSLG